MVCFKTRKKKGNITIILIGLISVMIIMSFALSRRMSGHSQLLTLSDYTQISRYFLESYAGDVLRQINSEANKLDSSVFKSFRGKAKNGTFDSSFYSPSPMLNTLAKELEISFSAKPKIRCLNVKAIPYPIGFDCPNNLKKVEKTGTIELLCEGTFRKKKYTLRVQYPFKVVMRMTPIIKDFMLFVDKISKEQGEKKIGPDDMINIISVKDGKHPDIVDPALKSLSPGMRINAGRKFRPFVLLAPWDATEYASTALSGKVYMGTPDDSVYLNIAGDPGDKNSSGMGELFLIRPKSFKVSEKIKEFSHIGVFNDKSGQKVSMTGAEIELKHKHVAKLGVLGFSQEIVPSLGTIFAGTAYKPADFFGSSSSASEFWREIESSKEGYMGFSSGLKLMGMQPPKGGLGPAREVYGNVFARFFVLTFWWPPSGGGEPLVYDEARSGNDFPERDVYGMVKYHFQPKDSYQKYQDFMSRMVSGKKWKPGTTLPDGFMPYNTDDSGSKRLYTYKEFKANDGFKAKASLGKLGKTWFGTSLKNNSSPNIGLQSRITKAFSSGKEFLDAALNDDRFDVNGIVYIKGKLDMPVLNMKSDKIGGGVIVVDGPINLKSITRGYNIDTNRLTLQKSAEFYQKFKIDITQESFLTFVSLSGDPITVDGETLLGVHLINLNYNSLSAYNQIIWKNKAKKEILFCGGIACNYLNLAKRLEEFGKVSSADKLLGAPFFMYHSAMAAEKPSMAAQMMENMRGYKLTSKNASK